MRVTVPRLAVTLSGLALSVGGVLARRAAVARWSMAVSEPNAHGLSERALVWWGIVDQAPAVLHAVAQGMRPVAWLPWLCGLTACAGACLTAAGLIALAWPSARRGRHNAHSRRPSHGPDPRHRGRAGRSRSNGSAGEGVSCDSRGVGGRAPSGRHR